MIKNDKHNKEILEQATFGAGCFWCVEAIFERLEGVKDVWVGYTGGKMDNPTYEDVCSGQTGHVEVIQLDYDPQIVFGPKPKNLWEICVQKAIEEKSKEIVDKAFS